MGLGQFTLSYPMNLLSGGEKTRVFLAGMDIHHPSVVLMDEPTNHLDSSGRQRLYDWVEKYRSTLLVVSHDRTLLNLLPRFANWRSIKSIIMAEITNSTKNKNADAGSIATTY